MTDSRTRLDRRIAGLGPDILAPELDEARFLRRLREDDPTRPIGDALLDQRTIAGIGNMWKVEGCFAAGIDPWRPRRRGLRRGGAGDRRRDAAADAALGRRRDPGPLQGRLRQGGPPVPALRGRRDDLDRAGARPGRRQPADLLVRDMPGAEADRPQGRGPHRARQHARELRRRARARRRHDRVRRAARGHRRPRAVAAAARARLLARPRARADARARGSRTSPARRSRTSSSTSTSSCPATRRASSTRCARTGSSSARSSRRSTCAASSMLRELEPALRLGWSVPRVQARLHAEPALRRCPPTRSCSMPAGGCRRSPPATSRPAAATR